MTRVEGSLAMKLDFAEGIPTSPVASVAGRRPGLRLASLDGLRSSGRGKYRTLEVRRRRAQIAARHLLDLIDAQESTR